MVNVVDAPVQLIPPLVKVGVIVIVAVTGVLPALMAVNDGMVLVPLAPSPMDRLLLLQLYTVPATGTVIVTDVVLVTLHTYLFASVLADVVLLTGDDNLSGLA